MTTQPSLLRPWRPLLSGELAQQASATVDGIAGDLADLAGLANLAGIAGIAGAPTGFSSGRDLSLAGGLAGVALFFSYLHFTRPGQGHDDIAMELLERAIAGTAELPVGAGLYGGFAGVAWTLEHLTGRLFDPEGEDPGEEITGVLRDYLGSSPWRGDYDLISGLVGFGAYALERLPRAGGLDCLAATVARLAETAEERPEGGISWHTTSEQTGVYQRDTYPEGYYNLGVAHGVPGVIGLLGDACAAGLPPAAAGEARRLLGGAFDWVFSRCLPADAASRFPYNFAPGMTPGPSRLAWCYGDLGIAAALLAAARATGDPAREAEVLAVARHAAARPVASAGVQDAGLCHGAAGVGHLFNRLYQASGDEALGAAARTWFAQALALRQPGEGIGGYRAWLPLSDDMTGDLGWKADPGFLTGSAGVGLALLAATSEIAPDWDRVLLTAVPPR